MLGRYKELIITALLFGGIMALITYAGQQQIGALYKEQQYRADGLVQGVSQNIQLAVDELRRSVKLFAEREKNLVIELAKNPENEFLHQTLIQRANDIFPQAFAITVVDQAGQPLIDDFDGFIGDICRMDMRYFAERGQYPPLLIHPNNYHYHLDFMARLDTVNEPELTSNLIFFISFEPDLISNVLNNAQLAGHKLMLLRRGELPLVEIMAEGARDLLGENIVLNQAQLDSIVSEAEVPNTQWRLVDMQAGDFLANRVNEVRRLQLGGIFVSLVFAVLVLLFIWRDKRALQFKENELLAKQEQLLLTNSELEVARDKALDASKAKALFLAKMSHEIRTPMNGILGMLQLVRDTELSPQQQQTIQTAYESSQDLLVVLNDLLDISKIEAGKLELEQIDFDLQSQVEQVVELFSERARQKGLRFTYQLTSEMPRMVMGDPTRLRQILNNLIGNSIKFTKSGGIELNLSLATSSVDNKVAVHVEVVDSGIGMTPEQCTRVFDAFTQADDSTTRHFGGTGLGLAITKQIVEAMGGEITITSEVNQGSCFAFDLFFSPSQAKVAPPDIPEQLIKSGVALCIQSEHIKQKLSIYLDEWQIKYHSLDNPNEIASQTKASVFLVEDKWLERLPEQELKQLQQQVEAKNIIAVVNQAEGSALLQPYIQLYKPVTSRRLLAALLHPFNQQATEDQGQFLEKQGTILVAEDNVVNQAVIQGMLGNLGYQVELADDGEQVVELASSKSYAMILMDIQMPKRDGYEATAEIRKRTQDKIHIPIIALTANTMKGDMEKCLNAGMDDFVAKPVKLELLKAMVEKYINGMPSHETKEQA